MDKGKIDKMSGNDEKSISNRSYTDSILMADQQLGQLYELMQATKRQGREDSENDEGVS